MKSPPIRTVSVPHSQRLNSAKWFEEWGLEQKALTAMRAEGDREEDDLFPVASASSRESGGFRAEWPAPADPARDPWPAASQIRLLPPDLTPGLAPPLYVAILSDWEDGLLLVAPFTSFLAPATGGELLTGRREPSLAVLAAWATVSVSPFVLARSWYIDAMTEDLRTAAWQVFQHAATGLALPDSLEDRVGAPIVHPFDPRIRYQRRISALMKPMMELTAKQEAADWPTNIRAFDPAWFEGYRLPAAAASGEPLTPCILLPEETQARDWMVRETPTDGMVARCIGFDPLIPGAITPACCEWRVSGTYQALPAEMQALVYDSRTRKQIGTAEVHSRTDGLLLILSAHHLDPDDPPVDDPGVLRIVIVPKP